MSGDVELLALRLALLAILFVYVGLVARYLVRAARPEVRRRARPLRSANLVVVVPGESGLPRGARIPLAGRLIVGRAPETGIPIGDPSVSAHHAELEERRGRWYVRDLGSTNGTYVDRRAIGSRWAWLRPGAELRLGAVVLRFEQDGVVRGARLREPGEQPHEAEVHD